MARLSNGQQERGGGADQSSQMGGNDRTRQRPGSRRGAMTRQLKYDGPETMNAKRADFSR